MRERDILTAWSRILRGHKPFLSIEMTRECPLRCPGCYAYDPGHLGNGKSLRDLPERRGEELLKGVMDLVDRHHPLHVSLVGGEPLLRRRELDLLLPRLARRGIEVQLVTSAVTPIPLSWSALQNLRIVVSVDGLQPEHERRRSPATYARILRHISGHKVTIHCTITRRLLARRDYLDDFAGYWSGRPEARKIWFSLYTPQHEEDSEERLRVQDRVRAVEALLRLRASYPKVDLPKRVTDGYLRPPSSPSQCIFAQTTTCISADLSTPVSPCQLGGQPLCSECGCLASAGLASIGAYRIGGRIRVSDIFWVSKAVGEKYERWVTPAPVE